MKALINIAGTADNCMLHCCCSALSYAMTDVLTTSHIKWFCLFKISLMCIVFTGVARSNAFSRFLEQEWCEVLG